MPDVFKENGVLRFRSRFGESSSILNHVFNRDAIAVKPILNLQNCSPCNSGTTKAEQKPPRSIQLPDEDWSGMEKHWHFLRSIAPDALKSRFAGQTYRELLSVSSEELHAGKGVFQDARKMSRPVELKATVPGVPCEGPDLSPTLDRYEVLTWRWMRRRCRLEDEAVAKGCVQLFFLALGQLLVCSALCIVGFMSSDGWELEVQVPLVAIGAIGICSALVGSFGTISEASPLLQKFWIGQLWMLSLLVFFIYTESHNLLAPRQCPVRNLAACHVNKSSATTIVAIACCLLQLLMGYCSVHICTVCLDAIDHRTAIQNHMALFKYFQYYYNELQKRAGVEGGEEVEDDEEEEEEEDDDDTGQNGPVFSSSPMYREQR